MRSFIRPADPHRSRDGTREGAEARVEWQRDAASARERPATGSAVSEVARSGRVAWGRLWALMAVVFLAGSVGWWAAREVLVTPQDPLADAPEPVLYEVVEGSVGRSLSLAAVAEWEATPVARIERSGIVTSLEIESGAVVEPGDILFTVDLRPVVVAAGDVPTFRDMGRGDEGEDIAQLQRLLVSLGYLQPEPDGVFGTTTRAAVRQWQDSLGIRDDGAVLVGDVMFVPELPARIILGEAITVGSRLAGGEEAALTLTEEPAFWVPLTPEQRSLVPLDSEVWVSYGDGVWQAQTVRAVETDSSQTGTMELRLVLEALGGGTVCGQMCAEWVGLEGRTDFPAEVVVVPETEGPVVPIAGISTDPEGNSMVTLESGDPVEVEMIASYGGQAVVEGVQVGDVLRLPFGDSRGPRDRS